MSKKNDEEKKKVPEAVESFGDFEFMNQLKYERAITAVGSEDKAAILAEYDRLGGFIRYKGHKVVNGAFWDSRKNQRVEKPEPKIIREQAAVVEETIEAPIDGEDSDESEEKPKGRGRNK